MYLFILVLLIVFVVYLYPKRDRDQLAPIKNEVYKYSGLNPDLYHSFLNNMKLMKQYLYSVDLSSKYLYQAIDNLQDLALNAKGGSTGFIDEVHEIASHLGNEAELMILEVALEQGVRFHPKFIKHVPNSNLDKFCEKYPTAPECNLKDYSSRV
jgi:hypothetical protein